MQKLLLHHIFAILLTICSARKGPLDESYKLPKNVKPVRYTLTMEPEMDVNVDKPVFIGSVTIELKVLETSNNITLHTRYLNISDDSIKIVNKEGTELKVSNTSMDENREFFTIFLDDALLDSQPYNLSINGFSGFLKYDNIGFYLAKYKNEQGQERHIAVTDFEPSDARKAFPCFDEPATKSTFIINVIRPENYTSISNEEITFTQNLGNGKYQDTFKETIPMSAYVVAFAVSQFKHTLRKENQRIFARPEAIESGKLDYALSQGIEILRILEEYTGVSYKLSKMDQVAIPDKYFNDEAMENWGLVTFSEKHLFISNETSKTEDYQRCTSYIAHEFSHQWFGNLVTFKDWKYIWLSEGFGAYMQFYIASLAKPSSRFMDLFVIQTLQPVFEYDSSNDTQPMNYQPKFIGSIPSPWICYYKASAVLRMTEHFLTLPIFRRGLNIYLEKNKFSAVEPADLYRAFQEAVDEAGVQHLLGNNSISSIMKIWDSNAGYPLLTVSRDYEKGSITISQSRYLEDNEVKDDSIWYVPVSYAMQFDSSNNFSDTKANLWLTEKSTVINGNSKGWLLVNKQQSGFYRVNYDPVNWERLAAYLNSDNYKSIHVVNRAQLLFDSFSFAQVGEISYNIPLNLSKYLIRETDYVPITPFINAIQYIDKMMTFSEMYEVFKNYVVTLLSTAYDYLGFDEKLSDTDLDKLNRIQILHWLCQFGHNGCRAKALEKVRHWKETGKLSVTPNLESTVLCSAMKNAGTNEWEFLYNKTLNNDTKKANYFEALACSEDKNILYNFIKKIFNNETLMGAEDRMIALSTITNSKIGLDVGLQFVLDNEDLPKRFQAAMAYYLGVRFTTKDQLAQLQTLNSTRHGQFNYGIKLTQKNIEWLTSHKKPIEDWLLTYTLDNQESANIV